MKDDICFNCCILFQDDVSSASFRTSPKDMRRACVLASLHCLAATATPWQREVRIALDAVSLASRVAVKLQSRAVVSVQKSDASPVTVADFTVQAIVLSSLAKAFPSDRFIAEESSAQMLAGGPSVCEAVVNAVSEFTGSEETQHAVCAALDLATTGVVDGWSSSKRTWVLDPIDGTKGFVRGDQFAIALALLDGGRPVLGFLGCPKADMPVLGGSIFWAMRGHGAFRRGLANEHEEDVNIRVDPLTDPERVVPCEAAEAAHTSYARSSTALSSLGFDKMAPIRIDGQGKYGLLACGVAHVYMRLPRAGYVENIWDHAAGACIIEEAHGRVSDLDGNPLDFSQGASLSANAGGIIATNDLLHDAVLRALQ